MKLYATPFVIFKSSILNFLLDFSQGGFRLTTISV